MALQIGATTTVAGGDFYAAPVTVLSLTPSATRAKRCRARVSVGDGVSALNVSGGQLMFMVSVGSQVVGGGSFDVTVVAGSTRVQWESPELIVPAATAITVTCQSSNDGDVVVNATGNLWSGEDADVRELNGALTDGTPTVTNRPIFFLRQLNVETNAIGEPALYLAAGGAGASPVWLAGRAAQTFFIIQTSGLATQLFYDQPSATELALEAAKAAIVAYNLDHLALTPTVDADMTAELADNTILARALAGGDTSTFLPATHCLKAIRVAATAIATDLTTILANYMRRATAADFPSPAPAGYGATVHVTDIHTEETEIKTSDG